MLILLHIFEICKIYILLHRPPSIGRFIFATGVLGVLNAYAEKRSQRRARRSKQRGTRSVPRKRSWRLRPSPPVAKKKKTKKFQNFCLVLQFLVILRWEDEPSVLSRRALAQGVVLYSVELETLNWKHVFFRENIVLVRIFIVGQT